MTQVAPLKSSSLVWALGMTIVAMYSVRAPRKPEAESSNTIVGHAIATDRSTRGTHHDRYVHLRCLFEPRRVRFSHR